MSSFPPQIRRRNVRNRERLHDRYRGIRRPVTGEKQTDVFENAYSITLVYNKIKGKLKKTPPIHDLREKNSIFSSQNRTNYYKVVRFVTLL